MLSEFRPLLENYFLFGDVPAHVASGGYSIPFIILSYIIASASALAGMRLAIEIRDISAKNTKFLFQAGAAFAFGAGIWSMHFIGMLAYQMDMAISYDPFITFLSMAIAVLIAYCFLQTTRRENLSFIRGFTGAILLGIAICGMHYTGMAAMDVAADIRYKPALFILSFIIAVTAAGAALWIFFTLGQTKHEPQYVWLTFAALVMGAAICGMHYTGMAAAVFLPLTESADDTGHSYEDLALSITAVVSLIFGSAMMLIFYKKEIYIKRYNVMNPFPAKFLLFSLTLTAIALFGTAISNYHSYSGITGGLKENLTEEHLVNKIMLLEQRQKENIYRAIETRDPKWETAYQEGAIELESLFEDLVEEHRSVASSNVPRPFKDDEEHEEEETRLLNAIEENDEIRDKYIEEIFALIRQGQPEKALRILESKPYRDAEFRDIDAMAEFTFMAYEAGEKKLGIIAQNIYLSLYPAIVAIAALSIIWFLLLRRIQHWRTQLEATRNTLEEEKLYLGAILDNMMQGVITIDKNGRIKTFNKWAEFIFGYQQHEIVGKNVKMLMPDPWRSQHDQYIQDYLRTGKANIINTGRDVIAIAKNGKTFPIHLSIAELDYENDKMFVGLVRDISEQQEKEQKLTKAIETANKANAAKSEFLANMSHELRTPLNTIMGITGILAEDKNLNEDNKHMAGTVYKSATSLLEVVNDILDVSKIESGNMVLEKIPFNLQEIVTNVIETMAPVASEKGITLKYHFANERIPYISGDGFRVSRILTNLISNAIKYTDKGEVELSVESQPIPPAHYSNDPHKVEICCEVRDTGIGIPEDKLNVIFEKFTQADETITRRYGGTGLGLAITKDLVEMMNGEIGVESKVGKGSVFWFKIPFDTVDELNEDMKPKRRKKRQRKKKKADQTLMPVQKARILVAEDHLLNKEFMLRLLDRMGFEYIDIVENGKLAVEAYEQGTYDIILMDCHMPEKNGYEATEAIRKKEKGTPQHIPIIALTADAMSGTQEKCLKAGMDEYIAKPIDTEELKEILEQWVSFAAKDAEKSKSTESGEESGPVDMSLLKEYANTPEDMKHFIEVFLNQAAESLQLLEDESVDGENQTWVGAAHKLKGGAGMIGAKQLYQLCEQAQKMQDTSETKRKNILKKIQKEYGVVKKHLDQYLT